MATSYTTLLGFALPATGGLSGTWGDVVNDSITQLVEDAIAGSVTADVTSGDWTLSTTGSGQENEARNAVLIPTGTPGTTRNIIAPGTSKAYIVINQSNGSVVVKASATTGVTVGPGAASVVVWNGSDFVTVTGISGTVVTTDATQTLTNKTLTSPELTTAPYVNGSYRGNVVAVAALNIDCSLGNYFTKTISANSTFTFSNAPASRSYAFTFELTHTSGTVTWPASVQWPGGTAPALSTGKTHLFVFVTDDGGTRWRGAALIDYTN